MSITLDVGGVQVPGRVWIAPMTGVSDLPFRKSASRLGAAYVATEMVASAEFAKGRPDVVRRAAVGEGLRQGVRLGLGPRARAEHHRLDAGAAVDQPSAGQRSHGYENVLN